MSEITVNRRRMFMLTGAALAGAVATPALNAPTANAEVPDSSDLAKALGDCRANVNEGQQIFVKGLADGDLWVQKFGGVVSTQLVSAGEQPLDPETSTAIWQAGAVAGAEESIAAQAPVATSASQCALATATASILTGIGGAGIAALAIANPAGLVLGGVFFSASMLNYAALIVGSYSATVGWLGAILC